MTKQHNETHEKTTIHTYEKTNKTGTHSQPCNLQHIKNDQTTKTAGFKTKTHVNQTQHRTQQHHYTQHLRNQRGTYTTSTAFGHKRSMHHINKHAHTTKYLHVCVFVCLCFCAAACPTPWVQLQG